MPTKIKREYSHKKNSLAEIANKNKFITGAFVVSIVTFVGYLFAYFAEAGYLSKFGLPLSYIDLTLEKVIMNILYPTFSLIIFISTFWLMYKLKEGILGKKTAKNAKEDKRSTIYDISESIVLIVIIYLITLGRESNYINQITFGLFAVAIILIFIGSICKGFIKLLFMGIAIITAIGLEAFHVGRERLPENIIIKNNEEEYLVILDTNEGYIVTPLINGKSFIPIYTIINFTENDMLYYTNNNTIEKVYNQSYYEILGIKSIQMLLEEENIDELLMRPLDEIEYFASENNFDIRSLSKKNIIEKLQSAYNSKKNDDIDKGELTDEMTEASEETNNP